MGGKAAHVHPDLCDQNLRRPTVYSRDGVKELHFIGERGDHPLYLSTQLTDGLIEVVDVREYPADHECMVSRETALQGLLERRYLRAQSPPSKLGQHLRVGGAANERIEHCPSRGTKYTGGHR